MPSGVRPVPTMLEPFPRLSAGPTERDSILPHLREKGVLSARGFKRVGRHSEYAI